MQFKRSKGNFRETDRVVRFKLIKSGKNWLRASTAALGLFRVVRGQVEETIIANVQQDQIESQKHNQAFLKGLITVGTVFGGAVLATTAKAEDATSLAPTVSETKEETLADRGTLLPKRLWRIGRTGNVQVFKRELYEDSSSFVVDVLIDASGSQRSRQGQVAIQAYILSEALSNVGIPHRVTSFCTFWDYTVLHNFRDYDADRTENSNIFEYVTSSNNRDGLAVKAVEYDLLQREEEHKILIVLSDGKPYDVILNRPNARNPKPYHGDYAIKDTGFAVRKLRNQGVCVLGVFAGEEKDLQAEKKIFGKDFAYIRDISGFSPVVGRYLIKQLEKNT